MSAFRVARIMLGLASTKCGSWFGLTRVVISTCSFPISSATLPIHGSVATTLTLANAGVADSKSAIRTMAILRIGVLLQKECAAWAPMPSCI